MTNLKKLKANKGEWSEFYAFVKILSDGKLFAADKNLEIISGKSFEVLNVSREEISGNKVIYDLVVDPSSIFMRKNNIEIGIVKKTFLKEIVSKIFSDIHNAPKGTFISEAANEAMNALLCKKIAKSSQSKKDLDITIQDRVASTDVELGFSVKSFIGGAPSLLNASTHTNFTYSTAPSKKGEVTFTYDQSNQSRMLRNRISVVEHDYGTMEFNQVDSKNFEKNLKMIDSNFPRMMAEILLAYSKGKGTNFENLVQYLKMEGVLEKIGVSEVTMRHKIKEFLVSVALGMTPSKEWDGNNSAHGGYIVVKENGEVICYNLYNMEEFRNYLYDYSYIDTPSTGRHRFGTPYEDGGKIFMKLNLQIRFRK